MKLEKSLMDRVQELVETVNLVYVATASKEGLPHIAASDGMTFINGTTIFFRAWFCRKTVENLFENPKLSVVVFDPATREGYQLLGKLERIEEGAVLNGFSPAKEKEWAAYPQSEYQLSIQVDAISHLTSGPHSDDLIR